MAQKDIVDVPKLTLAFVLGVILTMVIVIAVQALYFAEERAEFQRKEVAPRPNATQLLLQEQRAHLEERVVVEKGPDGTPLRVKIPIDLAMRLVLEKQGAEAR